MGARLLGIVAEGTEGTYLSLPPVDLQEQIARDVRAEWKPDVEFMQQALGFRDGNYGLTRSERSFHATAVGGAYHL